MKKLLMVAIFLLIPLRTVAWADNDNYVLLTKEQIAAIDLVSNSRVSAKNGDMSVDEFLKKAMKEEKRKGNLMMVIGWFPSEKTKTTQNVIYGYNENRQQRKAEWQVDLKTRRVKAVDDMAKMISGP